MCHIVRVSLESHKELVTQKKIFHLFILPILLVLFLSQSLRLNEIKKELLERLFRASQEGLELIGTLPPLPAISQLLSLRCLETNSILHSGVHLRFDNFTHIFKVFIFP